MILLSFSTTVLTHLSDQEQIVYFAAGESVLFLKKKKKEKENESEDGVSKQGGREKINSEREGGGRREGERKSARGRGERRGDRDGRQRERHENTLRVRGSDIQTGRQADGQKDGQKDKETGTDAERYRDRVK